MQLRVHPPGRLLIEDERESGTREIKIERLTAGMAARQTSVPGANT